METLISQFITPLKQFSKCLDYFAPSDSRFSNSWISTKLTIMRYVKKKKNVYVLSSYSFLFAEVELS